MPADYLTPVTCAASARTFLAALHAAGLLYHPEDCAFDCLPHHGLAPDVLTQIECNMVATFRFLPDPCDTALDILWRMR